jgi:amino-acid N-acetyltransferase
VLRADVLLVMRVTIERAKNEDGPAILALLANSALPIDGLLDHLTTAIVARADGQVVGCAALEVYLDGALLRSVAVDAAAKRQGVGTQLTQAALDLAHTLGMPAVYLLTMTAERFFPKFAFEPIPRQAVPASVQNVSGVPLRVPVDRRRDAQRVDATGPAVTHVTKTCLSCKVLPQLHRQSGGGWLGPIQPDPA